MQGASEPGLLSRAELLGRWIENALLVALLIGLILLASGQIVLRNVFSIGLPWADGLIRLMVLWLAVVGAVAASRDDKHIAIRLASRILPEPLLKPVGALVDLFAAAIAGALAWFCWRFVSDSREFGDVLLGDWPAWLLQLVLPVGFALIAYRYGLRCLQRLAGRL